MADDAPEDAAQTDADPPQPAPPSPERAGEFERYALIAALTLVVLCLLVWDRWHDGGTSGPAPRPDRTLRVEIGGDAPAKPAAPPPKSQTPHVASDAPPSPPPPPPPQERTVTVKSGETLSDIARRELGTASRAQELAELNGIDDPTKLRAGQTLKLPAK
jgi:nucleoid-associated protein YgaU